jgi:hypothetical protein
MSQLGKLTFHFIEEAVEGETANLKDQKAVGPDGLYSEHLKDSRGELLTMWTELFIRCIEVGTIPQKWRHLTVKVLYKGKGDADDVNKYQDDVLGMLTIQRLLTKRLLAITENVLPDSSIADQEDELCAVTNLLNGRGCTEVSQIKFYVILVDYTNAFTCWIQS